MPSVNKTPNIGLKQWEDNEYPKRIDFNEDNTLIDTKIGEIEQAIENVEVPVKSVNNKTGDVNLNTADIGAETPAGAQKKANTAETNAKNYADSIKPIKVSQLTNDAGFIKAQRTVSDSVSSTSASTAASSKAVKTAYDEGVTALNKANSAYSKANSNSTQMAELTKNKIDKSAISNSVTSTSTTNVASSKAVKTAYDKANHSHPYAPSSHTHKKSQITDFPSSLPANGGNADTVDGKHASAFALNSKIGYIAGYYTGDDAEERIINLGFTPSCVILSPSEYSGDYTDSGIAVTGMPAGENRDWCETVKVTSGGFIVHYVNRAESNRDGMSYNYIAFK